MIHDNKIYGANNIYDFKHACFRKLCTRWVSWVKFASLGFKSLIDYKEIGHGCDEEKIGFVKHHRRDPNAEQSNASQPSSDDRNWETNHAYYEETW